MGVRVPPARTNYLKGLDTLLLCAIRGVSTRVCNSCVIASGILPVSGPGMFDNCSPFELVKSAVDSPVLGMGITKHHR